MRMFCFFYINVDLSKCNYAVAWPVVAPMNCGTAFSPSPVFTMLEEIS